MKAHIRLIVMLILGCRTLFASLILNPTFMGGETGTVGWTLSNPDAIIVSGASSVASDGPWGLRASPWTPAEGSWFVSFQVGPALASADVLGTATWLSPMFSAISPDGNIDVYGKFFLNWGTTDTSRTGSVSVAAVSEEELSPGVPLITAPFFTVGQATASGPGVNGDASNGWFVANSGNLPDNFTYRIRVIINNSTPITESGGNQNVILFGMDTAQSVPEPHGLVLALVGFGTFLALKQRMHRSSRKAVAKS